MTSVAVRLVVVLVYLLLFVARSVFVEPEHVLEFEAVFVHLLLAQLLCAVGWAKCLLEPSAGLAVSVPEFLFGVVFQPLVLVDHLFVVVRIQVYCASQ